MKRVIFCFLFLGALTIFPARQKSIAQEQTVTTSSTPGAAGLDLQAVTEIVKQSKNAAEIEKQLNEPGSINNLDLDGDGNVDYVHVTEYGHGSMRGFSFTVFDSAGGKQEVASIEIDNVNKKANVTVIGNPIIYGPGECYTGVWVSTDVLLWYYLWHPHRYYYSPYHFGYYPAYYHAFRPIGHDLYRGHVTIVTKTTVVHRTVIANNYRSRSPNARYLHRSRSTVVRPTPRLRTGPSRRDGSNVRSRRSTNPRESGGQSRRREKE